MSEPLLKQQIKAKDGPSESERDPHLEMQFSGSAALDRDDLAQEISQTKTEVGLEDSTLQTSVEVKRKEVSSPQIASSRLSSQPSLETLDTSQTQEATASQGQSEVKVSRSTTPQRGGGSMLDVMMNLVVMLLEKIESFLTGEQRTNPDQDNMLEEELSPPAEPHNTLGEPTIPFSTEYSRLSKRKKRKRLGRRK